MDKLKCKNCEAVDTYDDFHPIDENDVLCDSCFDSYERYLDENADNIAAQERYENFLAEC